MDLRSAPLRLVIKRDKSVEFLECGHQHQKTYRQAKRRRCRDCLLNKQAEVPPAEVEIESEDSNNPRCAYCHDSLDNKVVSCSDCRTILHLDCSKELGHCPILGCRGSFKRNSTPQTTSIVIRIKSPLWKRIVRFPYKIIKYIFGLFGKTSDPGETV